MRRVVATTCGALVLSVVAAAGAAAVPGPGTFTRITTPSRDFAITGDGGSGSFPVSGVASADVASVDLDCIGRTTSGTVQVYAFATAVPVTSGQFHATATYSALPALACRLRAVPSSVDPGSAYLGSYAGPMMRARVLITSAATDATPYGFLAILASGEGVFEVEDAGRCADRLLETVPTDGSVPGHIVQACLPALPGTGLTTSGTADRSTVRVDGRDAWLPGAVHDYLVDNLGLPVAQSRLTTSMRVSGSGTVTITESAPLERCGTTDDAFPPTTASCPSLAPTGVAFRRVVTYGGAGHQAVIRDAYTSTDHQAHSLDVQYSARVSSPVTGAPGFRFPRHGSTYAGAVPGKVVTGLGRRAGTALIRSDRYSTEGDVAADTHGLTWSRAPAQVVFDGVQQDTFGMSYHLAVPAGGAAHLGFADSEGITTTDVRSLARQAVAAMVHAPRIAAPAAGAVLHRHAVTVRGRVALGANGLPVEVQVSGHRARLVPKTSTTATWSKRIRLSNGRHTIRVVATDAAGNRARSTIAIRVRH